MRKVPAICPRPDVPDVTRCTIDATCLRPDGTKCDQMYHPCDVSARLLVLEPAPLVLAATSADLYELPFWHAQGLLLLDDVDSMCEHVSAGASRTFNSQRVGVLQVGAALLSRYAVRCHAFVAVLQSGVALSSRYAGGCHTCVTLLQSGVTFVTLKQAGVTLSSRSCRR
eukprot:1188101-Prorocentrum_minimum.AAC.2